MPEVFNLSKSLLIVFLLTDNLADNSEIVILLLFLIKFIINNNLFSGTFSAYSKPLLYTDSGTVFRLFRLHIVCSKYTTNYSHILEFRHKNL